MDNKEKIHKDMAKDHLGNQYKNVKEMCEHYNIKYSVFYQRYVRYGWDMESALLTPVRANKKNTVKEVQLKDDVSGNLTEANSQKKKEVHVVQPESLMEEDISLTRANRIYNIDSPLKWYPSQEYVEYLKEQQKKKKLKNLPSMIQAINEKIRSCEGVQHFLAVMDLIYLGEEETARSDCDEDTFRMSKQLMEEPEGMIKDVYVDFVNYRKYQASLEGVALV